MRTREEIDESLTNNMGRATQTDTANGLVLISMHELLLDIRELLASGTVQKDYGQKYEEITSPKL